MSYYQTAKCQWADTDDVVFFGLASQAVTVDSAVVETDRGSAILTLTVSSGTGTLDVEILTRKDASADWRSVASFTQATGATAQRKSFTGLDRQVKATATIGTGPFVFSVEGDLK